MPTKLDQLKDKLRELFQLDRPDLDFGFYRIMHAKQAEIDRFLDKDLLPQVQAGLATLKGDGNTELEEAIKQAKALGIDPDSIPKVRDLKAKLGEPIDAAKVEDEIYSHLYRFFSRYYDSGDFISMRRYKEGVYAIPYEGEEVVLHWANKDQYYIKSSENLRDYTVKLGEGDNAPRLHFKLVEADIEKDNRKTAADNKRLFIFNPEKTEVLENEVVLGFEYRADPDNRKQAVFITACVDYVKGHPADFGPFAQKMLAINPTENKKDRTILEKHLIDYTATNTMDYFIHKDLGGFLRRELDFYIKNEVMHLDDIENETAPRVEQYLAQVRVLRQIARKLIDFMAQLEDFQKKLWLKKKFVVETNWCITLDRVPETLYAAIAANPAQWAEWEKLGFVEPAKPAKAKKKSGELELGDQAVPEIGTVAFLKAFPFMVIDTALYDAAFKQKLLAAIENIDEQTDGLLIHSENFQALELLQERYREQVKCVYIDPPYNTGNDDFKYKDSYQHSSWLSAMRDKMVSSKPLITPDGSFYCQLDHYETHNFRLCASDVFNFEREIIWSNESSSGFKAQANTWIRGHDTIYFFSKDGHADFCKQHLSLAESTKRRYDKTDPDSGEKYKEYIEDDGSIRKVFLKDSKGKPLSTVWNDIFSFQTNNAAREHIAFSTQKPTGLILRVLRASNLSPVGVAMDYFAGSGTTGHAVINLNREDEGKRKYILVEMGDYFDTVLKLRIQKVVFSNEWRDGKPTDPKSGISHCFKYVRLESYEDCLNNLELARTVDQDDLLKRNPALKEDYTLRYMLDVESRTSLLNVSAFADPFSYTLKVASGSVGESKPVTVDLVETLNYLIGLKVKTMDSIRGITVVTGESLKGEKILVLWRKTAETDNDALNTWFIKQGYNTQDMEFDIIYVNGDNNLENLRKDEETWKVRLTEEEFLRRMFPGKEA